MQIVGIMVFSYRERMRCKPISPCKLWKLQSESSDQHLRDMGDWVILQSGPALGLINHTFANPPSHLPAVGVYWAHVYRGPCIGIIYTHPFRVGGIHPLFPPTYRIIIVFVNLIHKWQCAFSSTNIEMSEIWIPYFTSYNASLSWHYHSEISAPILLC